MPFFVKSDKSACTARITSLFGEPTIVKFVNQHSHTTTTFEVGCKEYTTSIVVEASNSQKAARTIIAEKAGEYDNDTLSQVTKIESSYRSIRRVRQKNSDAPPNPLQRTGFEIPERFTKTLKNEQFLAHDTGKDIFKQVLYR